MATFTGTNGNDVLPPVGGNNSGADTMQGLGGNDTLLGGGGNDTLRGGTGSDTLEGEAGDDILDGGAGADTIRGGAGRDLVSYFGSATAVQVNLATNVNHGGDAEGDSFLDAIEIVHGSQFADTILGSAGGETLRGQDGNDALRGQAGDDGLEGGDGNDQLDGGDGADTLTGGAGADRLFGGTGTDTVSYADSGAGVSLNLTTNVNHGGTAEGDLFLDHVELVVGSVFADTVIGAAAADQVRGGAGGDTLRGLGGSDTLRGEAGADVLDGGDGDDFLDGGAGADRYLGGTGQDTVSYFSSSAAVQLNLATNANHGGLAEGDIFQDRIEIVHGSQFADTILGSAGAETLRGQGGDDVLRGQAGADVLEGGLGDDQLDGGAGADRIRGDAGIDLVTYFSSSAAVQLNLTTNVNHGGLAEGDTFQDVIEVVHGSQFGDTIVGAIGTETLRGFGGNDVLRGQAGASLEGGNGDDLLYASAGADRFLGGDGFDTLSYADSSAGVTVNLLLGTGSGGTAAGDRYLDGLDAVIGSGFNDTLISGTAAETFTGGAGVDTISYTGSAAAVTVDMVTRIGTGGSAQGDHYLDVFESITGTGFNDTLIGGDGAGVITGNNGDDLLMGGAGADQFRGGDGFDTVSYADSTVGVSVNQETNVSTGGTAEGDRFLDNVEAIAGSAFDDTIVSGSRGNLKYALLGGDGNDTLTAGVFSGSGPNHFEGQAGDDILTGGYRADILDGGDGADTIAGNGGTDTLIGGAGNDLLHGESFRNILDGGAGDDTLISGFGHEKGDGFEYVVRESTLTGGAGADRFVYVAAQPGEQDATSDQITDFSASQGDKIDLSQITSLLVFMGIGIDFIGTGAFTGVAGQLRYGYSGGDTYLSLDRDGDGVGDFQGFNLAGNVALTVDDFIFEAPSTGNRFTGTSGNDSLPAAGADSSGDDIVEGLGGNDALSGGNGNDLLIGGAGADRLFGGPGIDTASYADSAVGVNVNAATNVNTGGTAEGDVLFSTDGLSIDPIEAIVGSAFDDVITGALRSTVVLRGGDGNDILKWGFGEYSVYTLVPPTLDGGNGDDVLLGSEYGDRLEGGAGNDTITGGAGGDTIIAGQGDRIIYGNIADSREDVDGPRTHDQIMNFPGSGMAKIDLSAIDADPTTAGDQAFVFIGTGAGTGAGNELSYSVAGDGSLEIRSGGLSGLYIVVSGVSSITADDFIL